MPTEIEPSSSQKIYRPSLTQRAPALVQYGLLMLCVGVLSIAILSTPANEALKLVIVPIFLALAAVMLLICLWRTHLLLITSPQGIAYCSIGYRIFTPWENVEGIGTRIERGTRYARLITGLELKRPAPVFEVSPWIRFLLAGMESPFNFIPVGNVVRNWQRGEFARDIERYAPLLLRNPWTGERL